MNLRCSHPWSIMLLVLLQLAGCGERSRPMMEDSGGAWLDLAQGLRVNRDARTVAVRAWVCLDRGWLEQILCLPGTREHESLMVTDVTPSTIHAALLLIDIEPGRPGRWVEADGLVTLTPPSGELVDVTVQYTDPVSDRLRAHPISEWIADFASEQRTLPDHPFVFGGSVLIEHDIEGSNYAADHTGSVIGLVTFGDELLGAREVIPDAESVHAPEWVVRVGSVPPIGTEVLVLLSPAEP